MIQFKLTASIDAANPIVHDIHLDAGTLVLIGGEATTFAEAVAQDIKSSLTLFKQEWFLNRLEGVPWFEQIFVKGPDLGAIKTIFSQVIASRDGVDSVLSMTLSLSSARRLTVAWEVRLTDGSTLRSEDYPALILDL